MATVEVQSGLPASPDSPPTKVSRRPKSDTFAQPLSDSEKVKKHKKKSRAVLQVIGDESLGSREGKATNGGDNSMHEADDKSSPTEGGSSKEEQKHKEKSKEKEDVKQKAKKKHHKSAAFRHRLPPLTAAVVDGDLAKVKLLLGGKPVKKKVSKAKKKKRSRSVGADAKRKIVPLNHKQKKERRYTDGHSKTRLTKNGQKELIRERLLENDYMGATALHHACKLSKSVKDRDAIIDTLGEAMHQTECLYPIFSGLPGKKIARTLGKKGETPLHIAAKRGYVHALEVLLITVYGEKLISARRAVEETSNESGEDEGTRIPYSEFPNLKDARGRTPTHLAARNGHYDCLVLLTARDAALDYRDLDGMSPLDVAIVKGHSDCVMFLEKEGAGIDVKYYESGEEEGSDDEEEKEKKRKKRKENKRTLKRRELHKHVRELEAAENERDDDEEWEVDAFGWKIKPVSADDEDNMPSQLRDLNLSSGDGRADSKTEKNKAKKVQEKKDKAHLKKWHKWLKEDDRVFMHEKHANLLDKLSGKGGGMVKNGKRKKVVKLARKGIPLEIKGKVWAKLLEVDAWQESRDGKYEPKSYGSKFVKQIDLDIARTHRENLLFRERFGHKQRQLFRILRAYSVYDRDLGYTQGMSDVVGLLLMYNDDEEEVFWMLDILMNRFELKELFRPGFPRLMENFFIHDRLLQHFLPRVFNHLSEQGIHVSTYTTKWYLMIFLNLPFETLLRVWDSVLAEGYQLSFCIALALLEIFEDVILSLDFESTILFLQNLDKRRINSDLLIKTAVGYQRKIKPHNFRLLEDIRAEYRATLTKS